MIAGLIGRAFVAVARVVRGDEGQDLDHVGRELLRLETRHAQRDSSSR
jgi:hypothetical protein